MSGYSRIFNTLRPIRKVKFTTIHSLNNIFIPKCVVQEFITPVNRQLSKRTAPTTTNETILPNNKQNAKSGTNQFNFYIFILLFNVLLFVVWNIPFFKYLCEISYVDQLIEPIKHLEMIYNGIKLAPEITREYVSMENQEPVQKSITNYAYSIAQQSTDHSDVQTATNEDSNIYKVYFKTSASKATAVQFIPLQEYVYVVPNETNLVFFQAYNPTDKQINGISIYLINPSDASPYINKVQCFCFEELMIQPHEIVELPVLFVLDAAIKNKIQFDKKTLTINYILFAK